MNFVYYLCFSNYLQSRGLVFPYELEKDIYSPGIWIVNSSNKGKLEEEYIFEAIVNGDVRKYKMERVDNSVYKVDTENYGIYYFRLIRVIPSSQYEYIGNSDNFSKRNKFYQVVPMNIEALEIACHDIGLFFVGRGQ